MKKTLVEVMMCIKNGETWENDLKTITREENVIRVTTKNGLLIKAICFDDNESYSLVVNPVSFVDAFEAYEKGKIIKSLVGKNSIYKKNETNKEGLHYLEHFDVWVKNLVFEIEEIRGQWQILD